MMMAGAGLVAGAILVSRLTLASGTLAVLCSFAVIGIGSGLVNAPITQAAVSGMPDGQAGVASAIASTSRQVGQSLGVAVAGSILAVGLHGSLAGRTLHDGFIAASHAAWFVMAGCGLVVFALGLITTSSWGAASATRTGLLLNPAADTAGDVRSEVSSPAA